MEQNLLSTKALVDLRYLLHYAEKDLEETTTWVNMLCKYGDQLWFKKIIKGRMILQGVSLYYYGCAGELLPTTDAMLNYRRVQIIKQEKQQATVHEYKDKIRCHYEAVNMYADDMQALKKINLATVDLHQQNLFQ